MFKKLIIYVILSNISYSQLANSCTVWGAINPKNLVIAKNRDFYPGNQKVKTVKSDGKYAFFGLYGDNQYDGKYTIKMGANEIGLVE